MNDGKPWCRDELVVAFDLYCRIPFQKTKSSTPEVKELANLLRRSPAAVARKLGNFGSFDPELKKRAISGLPHTSHLDRVVWEEFHKDWAKLVLLAAVVRAGLSTAPDHPELALVLPSGPSERTRSAKLRVHQAFFRDAVLASYNNMCCVTGLPIVECLVASHVIPWSRDESLRADPTNGLCLSATFDRLFDRGLITVSDDMKVVVSGRLRDHPSPVVKREILDRDGQPVTPPVRFRPRTESLRWHMANVFQGS
jgi:hypothetical protein